MVARPTDCPSDAKKMYVVDMKKIMKITLLALAALTLSTPGQSADGPVKASPAEANFSSSLKAREEAVAAKEKELARREQNLDLMEKDVDGKVAELLALQEIVTAKLVEIRAEQDQEFNNLIKVYATMSASKLAPLLNQMEDANVAKILRAMKKDLTGKIIPKLEPQKAVRVSLLLGRISESSQ